MEDAVVEFTHARAEDLSDVISDRVDALVFCNAIHLVDSKEDVLNGIAAALKPGGSFALQQHILFRLHRSGNGAVLPTLDDASAAAPQVDPRPEPG